MSKVIKFKTSPVDSLPDDLMKIGDLWKFEEVKTDKYILAVFDTFDNLDKIL